MNSRQVPIEILLSWLREVCCKPHCLFRTYKLFSRQRPPQSHQLQPRPQNNPARQSSHLQLLLFSSSKASLTTSNNMVSFAQALQMATSGVVFARPFNFRQCTDCISNTAEKFDLHQIYSVQIWCKKVQTKVKDKDGKYAFVLKFTVPCKLASKCGIKPSLFLIPPQFALFCTIFAPSEFV